jgi:L-ascorbate metabolism protein UlaG (beta-lactamase superfamily)
MTNKLISVKVFIFFLFLASGKHTFAQISKENLTFKYFGAAGWEISDKNITILIDPYLSRLKLGETSIKLSSNSSSVPSTSFSDNRRSFKRTDFFESDSVVINKNINKADFIFIHHSHFDHLADVPYIAKMTGAKVIGTETTVSILKAYGIEEDNLYTVRGGEDYQFENFSIRVLPSIHSALGDKHYFNSEIYKEGDIEAPLQIKQFIEGSSLMFLIRFKSHKVLTMGSMNFIERELEGIKPDILLAGVNMSRFNMYKYDERLIRVTDFPKIIIPTHWDNFRVPYGFSQSVGIETKIKPFIEKVKRISPNSRVIIPEHLKPFEVN